MPMSRQDSMSSYSLGKKAKWSILEAILRVYENDLI